MQAALDRLMAGRTTLVIAHRLATVRSADRILVLNRGELIAEGSGDAIRADKRVREVYLGTGATSGGH